MLFINLVFWFMVLPSCFNFTEVQGHFINGVVYLDNPLVLIS